MHYDFEGWATKNDLRCSDGLTIRKDAFLVNDGGRVPLVWNHQHGSVDTVLGHADLENRSEGVYARCSFNNTSSGQAAKEAINHGDVVGLSIWANNVQKVGKDVIHGVIREVSLVLAGANPGAFVESVISHGESIGEDEDEGIIYTGEGIVISHGEIKKEDNIKKEKPEEEPPVDGEGKETKTVQDVINGMTDEQKAAIGIIVEQVIKDVKKDDNISKKEVDTEMRHNMFEGDPTNNIISHSDMETIISDAKRDGSLRDAYEYHMEHGVLAHEINTEGMVVGKESQTYGFNDPSMLFPDYKALNNTPEWISRSMNWVAKFMSKVHHTPFSRIKSVYANITTDEARARGYIKGKQKKEEVFTTLKRTTSPQTVYKKQKMDRDDVIDITDFDVIGWIKAEMRVMLDEEIARACLIGDGRPSDSDDKIHEDNIRPIASDKPLFNTIIKVKVSADADEATIAKETIRAIIRGRKMFKGSGKPDFWTTEDVTTEMLLLEDNIGHAIYKTESELATKLRVNEIIPVDPMEGQTVSIVESGVTKPYPLIGIIANVADYNIGADKGGEVNMFDDFDINFNQMLYLIETRISGALVKPFSAITIVLDKTGASPASLPETE